MQLKWYKLINVNYNIDEVLVWARKLQLSQEGTIISDQSSANGYLGEHQQYWTGEFPQAQFDYFNSIIPLDGTFKGIKTSCTLWEYQKKSKLLPHIHKEEKEIGGLLIVPLIGKFKTSLYENNEIVDSVEYSPGNIFFVKGKEFMHGGETVDDYRLNTVLYIHKDVDMDLYI
jgi:hypothetical protein